MTSSDTGLTREENLIAHVAKATCFAFRFPDGGVPESDGRLYVRELVALYQRKPDGVLVAANEGAAPESVATVLQFCADQLKDVAPDKAAELRVALMGAA